MYRLDRPMIETPHAVSIQTRSLCLVICTFSPCSFKIRTWERENLVAVREDGRRSSSPSILRHGIVLVIGMADRNALLRLRPELLQYLVLLRVSEPLEEAICPT
jgi:hypothetical protein